MFETAIDFMLVEHFGAGAFEPTLGRMGFARQLSPHRKPYRTLDGWMCILPYPDGNWRDFFGFIGRAELAADPRFGDVAQRVVHIDQLYQLVEQHAALQSTDSWMAFCDRVSIPCMPVLELEQREHDPHVVAIGLMELVDHPSEGRYRHLRSPLRFSPTPGPAALQTRCHRPPAVEDFMPMAAPACHN